MATRKFKLSFAIDNDAFAEDERPEIARILRAVAKLVEDGRTFGGINDINGDNIGGFAIKRKT